MTLPGPLSERLCNLVPSCHHVVERERLGEERVLGRGVLIQPPLVIGNKEQCIFTDGEYIKGSTATPTDSVVGFDLVNFGLPTDTHGCVLVITD